MGGSMVANIQPRGHRHAQGFAGIGRGTGCVLSLLSGWIKRAMRSRLGDPVSLLSGAARGYFPLGGELDLRSPTVHHKSPLSRHVGRDGDIGPIDCH